MPTQTECHEAEVARKVEEFKDAAEILGMFETEKGRELLKDLAAYIESNVYDIDELIVDLLP